MSDILNVKRKRLWKMITLNSLNKKTVTNIQLACCLVLAFMIYVIGCNWGMTSIFQPDEGKLVEPLRRMVESRTLLHGHWEYPTEATSKLLALILIFVNRFYHMSNISYYFVYRAFYALIGTGTVFITWMIIKRARGERFAMFTTWLMAVFPIWTQYTKEVTGDIPALFFSLLVLLISQYYIDTFELKYLILMSFFAACSTLEKWNGAWVAVYIAFIVIVLSYRNVIELITRGMISFSFFFLSIIVLAPNIVYDVNGLVEGIRFTYSYDGTKLYPSIMAYPQMFFACLGIVSVFVFGLGVYRVFLSPKLKLAINENVPMLANYAMYLFSMICLVVFWVVMTRIAFIRWGWGVYWGMLLLLAEGLSFLMESDMFRVRIVGVMMTILVFASFVTGSLRVVAVSFSSKKDTRIVGEQVLKDIGATTENTLSDYYTTFSPGGMRVDGNTTAIKFLEYKSKFAKVENNKLILKEPNIKYVVISERNSTNDYGYLAVKNYGKLIASVKSKGNNLDVFEMRPIGSWNISELDTIRNNINDIKLVLSEDVIGPSFDIYDVSSK